MKGSDKVIDVLNSVLTKELTAINQYFLHARMLENWGLVHLGHLEYKASIDEMKHADQLIKRVLFLEGLPNVQKLDRVMVGTNLEELIESDLKVEYTAVPHLKKCIKICEEEQDYVSREVLQGILTSEEHHIDWLETQRDLIKKVGLQNYMQSQMKPTQGGE
jgi:bacterioferritin